MGLLTVGRMRKACPISLEKNEVEALNELRLSAAPRIALRAFIVLLAAEGRDNQEIGEIAKIGRITAARWRIRYATDGIEALKQDLPRTGRPRIYPPNLLVLPQFPRNLQHARRVTIRQLAEWGGVSASTVQRNWLAFGYTRTRQKRS